MNTAVALDPIAAREVAAAHHAARRTGGPVCDAAYSCLVDETDRRATELHAEHSVRWTTGELPEHKAVLLDERVIARSRAWDASVAQ
jgi:hypothetical protein